MDMGDRRNIELKYSTGESIYLYTHWCGSDLPNTLASALDRGRDRWSDESYLARVIFSEMVKRDVLGVTGYGIAPYEIDPQSPTLVVDLKGMTVNSVGYEYYLKYPIQCTKEDGGKGKDTQLEFDFGV
jgi:hypothetical protein